MAEGATVGALKWVLGADTAQLEAATGRASASMRAAARAGEIAGAQITAAFGRMAGLLAGAFAVERIVTFTQESLHAAASLGRFSDQAGMTAQQFQGLEFALRDALVPTEQLAQGFAIFSRNFSDLQRNTGPFLDFLRQAAPQLIAQFRAARDTYEAFGVLTDSVNKLGDQYDRIRILNAAGAEQFAKLANSMRQGRGTIDETVRSFEGLTEAQVKAAQDIERRWTELWRRFTLEAQKAFLAVVDQFNTVSRSNAEVIEAEIRRLEGIKASQERLGRNVEAVTAQLEKQRALLNEIRIAADNIGAAPPAPAPVDTWKLQQNAIKAAQGELALYMQRLQGMPQQMQFVSSSYAAAWEKMRAVMQASGETASAIEAARLNLLMQQEQARLAGLQSIGITMSFEEQYQQTIQRTNSLLERGIITTQEAARAHQNAALTMSSAWAGALGQVAAGLAQAFPKQKAFAVAAAIINVAEGITKALTLPFPLNWVQAAAVAAAGLAQINAIKSTNPGSGGGSVAAVGSGASAGADAPTQSPQMLTLNLAPGRYSRDEVVGLINEINGAIQDGAQLVVKQ